MDTLKYLSIIIKICFIYGPNKIRHGEFIHHGYAMGGFARHSCTIAIKQYIT